MSASVAAPPQVVDRSAHRTRWVSAWAASPQPVWSTDFIFPADLPSDLTGMTVRQVLRAGYGGRRVRLSLSNTYGRTPVVLAGVHIAPSQGGARICASRDAVVRFGGSPSTILPPRATVTSDPVDLPVTTGDDLAVSIHFVDAPRIESFHWDGRRSAYLLHGDQLATATPIVASTTERRLFVSALLVEALDVRASVVILGDSITDGAGASLDAETRWPDFLAARAAPQGLAVINAGISGAQLLGDRMGANALARFDADVLAQPEVRAVIIVLGINDIAWPGTPLAPDAPQMTFERLTTGYRALAARARAANLQVIAGTLSPFGGALPGTPMAESYYSREKDALRRRINAWLRTTEAFDRVIDFDRLLEDPEAPGRLRPRFDSGDHLHPGDEGHRAMADAVDLDALFPR